MALRAVRAVVALAALCALGGCGPEAGVWLRVEAPLKVPDQCDALFVQARWDDANGPVAYEHAYALSGAQQFPMTLSLTADDTGASSKLAVRVVARKDGQVAPPEGGWAQADGVAEVKDGRMTELVVRLARP